jgi:alcohol dehydrogenase class IV
MNPAILQQPARIVFGNGCAPQCADFLAQHSAKRVLLVTSKSVRLQLGHIVAALETKGMIVGESRAVPAEPSVTFFEQALTEAREHKVDSVLAIGGGSVIDVAKLLAALLPGHQKVTETFGINQLAGRELKLVCLPTTAGTGAEVSPNAILLDESSELKKGVISPYLVPDAAYVDPALTVSVPPGITAASGLDALTHCIEAYANNFANRIADLYALEGVRLLSRHILRAVRNGGDLEAREAMLLGSLYGGFCLGSVNTAAVHALAYPLGGRFRIGHGVANALLLPHVLRFNLADAPGRYAEIAVALGDSGDGPVQESAQRGVDRLAKLLRECDLPQKLSALGIPRHAIPAMAAAAMQVTRLLKNNLRPLTEADAVRIYEEAY